MVWGAHGVLLLVARCIYILHLEGEASMARVGEMHTEHVTAYRAQSIRRTDEAGSSKQAAECPCTRHHKEQ